MKGTVVSTILAVMSLFLVVNAASLVVRAALYLAMEAASAFWDAVPPARFAGARWMAGFQVSVGNQHRK